MEILMAVTTLKYRMVITKEILRKVSWGLESKLAVEFEKMALLIAFSASGSRLTPVGC